MPLFRRKKKHVTSKFYLNISIANSIPTEICDQENGRKSKNIFFANVNPGKENGENIKKSEKFGEKKGTAKNKKKTERECKLLNQKIDPCLKLLDRQDIVDRLEISVSDSIHKTYPVENLKYSENENLIILPDVTGINNDADEKKSINTEVPTKSLDDDDDIHCDFDRSKKCCGKKKRKDQLSFNPDILKKPLDCCNCDSIVSLKDFYSEFEESLTQENREKFLEIKLALVEYEKTYNQELRVLLILARQSLSWRYYLPVFNRRCISRNIQKIKLHSDFLDQCLETKKTGNFIELIEIFDSHMEDMYLTLLMTYCENMGELRLMFCEQMQKDSEFCKLLFSIYFQMERTLLPIHHLIYIRSLIFDIIDIFHKDASNALYKKVNDFDKKLSKMLAKCYEITTSIHGTNFLRRIENLFPLDLKLSSSISDLSFDLTCDFNSSDDKFTVHVEDNIDRKETFNKTTNFELKLHQNKPVYDESIIRDKILNKNIEVDLLDLSNWINRLSFDFNDKRGDKQFNFDETLVNALESVEEIEDKEDYKDDIINILSGRSGKLELSDDSNDIDLSGVKVKPKDVVINNRKRLFCVLPFCYSSRNLCNKLKKNSKSETVYESIEMVDLSPISYQARLRLKRQYSKSGILPQYSVLNTSFDQEPIYQEVYAESSLLSDVDYISDGEDEIKEPPSAVFYTEPEEEYVSEKISSAQKTSAVEDESNNHITRPPPCNIQRTLWKETEKVITHGILDNMSKDELALQESKYEMLTSEVSYLKSLTILVAVFIESPEMNEILSNDDKENLFKHVLKVKVASEKFLFDLAGSWDEDILMKNVYKVINEHVKTTFSVYIDYCSNQLNLHRTLQRLLIQNDKFVVLTRELERSPECLGYSLDSFLSLPMQRVTRLPLLLQTIQRRLPPDSDEFNQCDRTLNSVCELAQECNEAVRRMEEKGEHSQMKKKLSLDIPKIGLASKFSKSEKQSGLRRWSLFSVREVKTTG